MELTLNIIQLQLKSEHLHTNPKHIHFHEDIENSLIISWDDYATVLYSLDSLVEATLWNPIEPVILPISDPVLSVLTFDSKVYCIDKIGSIYHLKQVQRESPDLFDCSPPTQVSQPKMFYNYKWISLYSQKFPCDIFGATYYSGGIALITTLGEWIILQMLQITINDNNEPIIFNTHSKKIRLQKQFPFLVTSFISCTWKDWFSNQQAIELFGSNVLHSQDIFITATEESKIYSTTSDIISENATLFLNCPQKVVHIQFCDYESKKLLLVSSSGIITVIHCVENIPPLLIYLAVTKVIAIFIVDFTVIVSDGINLYLITLDKQFSKIVKQVVTSLKGVLTLHKFQLNNIIAMTQLNKFYKLSPKYEVITQEEESKFKFNEKCVLGNIKELCKSIDSLEEQHDKMNKYINAVSVVARKDLVAQYCSLNILIYSGAKAVKLGALHGEYIFAIKLSTGCTWLSLSSTFWKILVRITDNKNASSNCFLHSFNVDIFNNIHPLLVKHHLLASIAENCTSGLVYCELVCQIQSDLINHCLVIPLHPIKLNSLYFVKVEKQEMIPLMNTLEDQYKCVFKFPENVSLEECFTIILNRNKHRTSKLIYTNITGNMPKMLYLNFFGKVVSVMLDDKVTRTIVLESNDRDALISIRDGVFNELSNNQPAIIKYSVLSDVQKQLCLLEELLEKGKQDQNNLKQINKNIQNQICAHLPI